MSEQNLSQEVQTTSEDQTYFLPDARKKINEMLKARSYRPRNREERRRLRKKLGKDKYDEFMVLNDTAVKLDYIELIQKLRELNEKKKNEVYDDEQATED